MVQHHEISIHFKTCNGGYISKGSSHFLRSNKRAYNAIILKMYGNAEKYAECRNKKSNKGVRKDLPSPRSDTP